MSKALKIIGGIVLFAAVVAGATYAVLRFLKCREKDNGDSCCFIDVDDYDDESCDGNDEVCDCGCAEAEA